MIKLLNLHLNIFNFNPFSYFHVAQKGARRLEEAYDRVLDSMLKEDGRDWLTKTD